MWHEPKSPAYRELGILWFYGVLTINLRDDSQANPISKEPFFTSGDIASLFREYHSLSCHYKNYYKIIFQLRFLRLLPYKDNMADTL